MSCENNILDLTPEILIVKKKLGDTLTFSVTLTDEAGAAINVSTASAISYYIGNSIVAGLGTGVTVSGTGSNKITVVETISGETVGTFDHKLIIVLGGAARTYFDGKLKIV